MKTLQTILTTTLLLLSFSSPILADAICNDGWQSTSEGSGTCSWHGGVSQWYPDGTFGGSSLSGFADILSEQREQRSGADSALSEALGELFEALNHQATYNANAVYFNFSNVPKRFVEIWAALINKRQDGYGLVTEVSPGEARLKIVSQGVTKIVTFKINSNGVVQIKSVRLGQTGASAYYTLRTTKSGRTTGVLKDGVKVDFSIDSDGWTKGFIGNTHINCYTDSNNATTCY